MKTILDLLEKIKAEGGCIVSSGDCGEMEIADAQARGDFYVDENNFGYVRRLPQWLAKHSRFARNAEPDNSEVISDQQSEMIELLRSARAIADRNGEGTNWPRFSESIAKLGISSITARTYRNLPSDLPQPQH